MRLRTELPGDRDPIRAVHLTCFPSSAEADLVDRLREVNDRIISLVAEEAGLIVGHVLFSRMLAPFSALGLGPVAVLPNWRRRGIAARLIEAGLAQAAEAGRDAVFVLGEPAYYGRFGFQAADATGFLSPYAGAYFMVRALKGRLPVYEGRVDYAPAFAQLG